jgi:hypothetical protein
MVAGRRQLRGLCANLERRWPAVYGTAVIRSLEVTDFTVFAEAKFDFGANLNVIIGENGVGKTHVIKLAYSILAASWAEGGRPNGGVRPTQVGLETKLAAKLVGVFRPETLGRMVRRKRGKGRSTVAMCGLDRHTDIEFSFDTHGEDVVACRRAPKKWIDAQPAYLPTRELLTIYPNFVSVYEGHYLEFEETWRDTCLLLGAPLRRGPREARVKELLAPLEKAMGGSIELDKNGRFYLKHAGARVEMPLVAEGMRKLGMLARLIATGALLDKGCLFWDEPEANLNPRLIKRLAPSILELAASGIQVYIATHSLFLLRELEILLAARKQPMDVRFFGLHQGRDRVLVQQGPSIDDVGTIAALDEELEQSDRYADETSQGLGER